VRVRLPRFQIIYYDSNAYIANHYNLLVTSKNHSKTIPSTKKKLKLIKALFKVGAISHYTLVKYNYSAKLHKKNTTKFFIKFSVFHFKNSPFYKTIRLVTTQSKSFSVTLDTIKLITPIFKTSLFILSTPLGVLTHTEALKLGTGGLILYILN
jgi:ribosomal protein S8